MTDNPTAYSFKTKCEIPVYYKARSICPDCDHFVETPKKPVCKREVLINELPPIASCPYFKKTTHRRIADSCIDCEYFHTTVLLEEKDNAGVMNKAYKCIKLNEPVETDYVCDLFSPRLTKKDVNYRPIKSCPTCKHEEINHIDEFGKIEVVCGKHGREVGEETTCDDYEEEERK